MIPAVLYQELMIPHYQVKFILKGEGKLCDIIIFSNPCFPSQELLLSCIHVINFFITCAKLPKIKSAIFLSWGEQHFSSVILHTADDSRHILVEI